MSKSQNEYITVHSFAYHYLLFMFAAFSCKYITSSSISLHCLLYAFPTGYFVRNLHLHSVSFDKYIA